MLTLIVNYVCQFRVIRKNFAFAEMWRCNTKLHDPSEGKVGLPCFEQIWLLNSMNAMVFRVFIFIFFCLEPTLRKDTWMRVISATVMMIFSKVPSWKLPGRIYVLSFFSTFTRHFSTCILKGILQLKILRTCIKIRANSFIKTWVNIMKWKSMKVPLKSSLAKTCDPAFQRTLHQNRWYFTYRYTLLFFSNKRSF